MTERTETEDTDAIAIEAGVEEANHRERVRLILTVAGVALATILVVGTLALAIATHSWVRSERMAPYVTIGGIEVAGMTGEEAVQALRTRWVPSLPDAVSVTFPGGEWDAEREELGVRLELDAAVRDALAVGREGGLTDQIRARLRTEAVDIAVPVQINEEVLGDAIGALSHVVDRDPVDADFKVVGEEIEIIPGKEGRLLDIEATMQAVRDSLTDPAATEVEAVVEVKRPSITTEDLAHIEVVLGRFSTSYAANRDRTHNLTLATRALNESLLRPGETLSFNETVGRRTAAGGYRAADTFVDGEIVQSIGGGICQVASTLYNAVLLANMDIVQRRRHSRPVNYIDVGRDATVYWGQQDLEFKNSLKHPVVILGEVGGGQITFRILGSRADKADVEITRHGLTRLPHEERRIDDPELEEGEEEVETPGRDGWRVTVRRKATRDGTVIRDQQLHSDHYAPQTEVIRVGTKPPEEPEEPELPEELEVPDWPDPDAAPPTPDTPEAEAPEDETAS